MTDSNPLRIQTEQGELQGTKCKGLRGDEFCGFLGIPYAKAPIGELRFKAPEPPESWSGVLDASTEGPECPSTHLFFGYHVGNEDNCLNLNVYTLKPPANNQNRPVMVFIHGGGFVQGCNKAEFYGPEYLVKEDVIVVTINYRLGILGFLCLEDPSLGIPGNAGLKDQVMALKWVQQNIKNFGGNPDNVTIFGESAGSASVHFLTLSPMCKGLFHKAILQSGTALNCWALGKPNAESIAKHLGIKDTSEENVLSKMLKLPAKQLVNAWMKEPDFMLANQVRPFGPVIEKPTESEPAFLSEHPLDIIKNGNFNKVPLIIGVNSKEGILYDICLKIRRSTMNTNFELDIPWDLGILPGTEEAGSIATKIKESYFGNGDITMDALMDLKTDNHFSYGILKTAQLTPIHNEYPVYLYNFDVDGRFNYFKTFSTSRALPIYFLFLFGIRHIGLKNIFLSLSQKIGFRKQKGASHADDLGYLFTAFFSEPAKENSIEEMSIKRMVKMWTNFATYGNPTEIQKGLNILWKPIEGEKLNYLDIGNELRCESNPFEKRVQFWDQIYSIFKK